MTTPPRPKPLHLTLLAVFLLLLVLWLVNTPAGLLGKADAVGYAVCHRIAARSFLIGDRPLPLCSRCSGMYLGALAGMALQFRLGRRSGTPPRKFLVILALFLLAFGVDGVNSYLHFFPALPSLYAPHNWMRLVTGTGLGLGLAAVVVPIFNQSVWTPWDDTPLLAGWREFGALLALGAAVIGLMLTENPLLLYPLALLSSFSVLLILSLVYTIVWILITKKENVFHSWWELWPYLTAGAITALAQIAVIDLLRYRFTGTWDGFSLGG